MINFKSKGKERIEDFEKVSKYKTKNEKLNTYNEQNIFTKYEDCEKIFNLIDLHGKNIFLPCDDPQESNFYKFALNNFEKFGINKIYGSFYGGYWYEYDGHNFTIIGEKGETEKTDFLNDELIKHIKETEAVVITNPPFTKEYIFIDKLMKNNIKFLLIGNILLMANVLLFDYFKNFEIKSVLNISAFKEENNKVKYVPGVVYSNIKEIEEIEEIKEKKYNDADGFEIINCRELKEYILTNKKGFYYVPITIFHYKNKDLFNHIEFISNSHKSYSNGKALFSKILIKIK